MQVHTAADYSSAFARYSSCVASHASYTAKCSPSSLSGACAPQSSHVNSQSPGLISTGITWANCTSDVWADAHFTFQRPLGDPDKSGRNLDQFYTLPRIARYFVKVVWSLYDLSEYQVVEPSAGTGSFCKLLPRGTWAFDLEPKCNGVWTGDFLKQDLHSDLPLAYVGNPPFGWRAELAIKFFNHAARHGSLIAMIVPRTFSKAFVQNQLDRYFHLVHEENVPNKAFILDGRPYHVPTFFQIWEQRDEPRELWPTEKTHPDFIFTDGRNADFAIRRVGGNAGKIHDDLGANPETNLFIRAAAAGVRSTMEKLELTCIASRTTGPHCIAKAEIVAAYSAAIAGRA